MAFAKISRQGLGVIAILVVCLWGCIVGERMLVRHARMETYRALRDMRNLRMKRGPEPVSAPSQEHTPASRGVAVG